MTRTHDEGQDRMQESGPRLRRRGFLGVLLAALAGGAWAIRDRLALHPRPTEDRRGYGLQAYGLPASDAIGDGAIGGGAVGGYEIQPYDLSYYE